MRNYYLTGSRGFIGSNLMKYMYDSKKVFSCIGIDKKDTNAIIESLDDNFLFSNHTLDIENKKLNKLKYYTVFEPDCLIHCASNVGVELMQKAYLPIKSSFVIDLNVLDFCIKNKLKLVYFSSSEIYGPGANLNEKSDAIIPLNSNSDTIGRANYALEKLFMERQIKYSKLKRGYLIVRPFNIAGPGQQASNGVIPKIIKQILTNEPVKLYRYKGKFSERSYCHIDDFCHILFELYHTYDATGVFNIGNPNNVVNNEELFYKILERMNIKEYKNLEIVDVEYDIGNRSPNIERVLNEIKEPNYKFKSLEEIIDDTIKYFDNFKYEGL